MRGPSRALAAALRRGLAAGSPQPQQPLGCLKHLQRGLATSSFGAGAGGAAAAAGRARWLAAVAAGLSTAAGLQLYGGASEPAECKADPKARLIDKEEVAKHRSKETGGRGFSASPISGCGRQRGARASQAHANRARLARLRRARVC